MNRFPLALIALSCVIASGCTEVDPSTDTDTDTEAAALAVASECTSGIQFNGQWPTIKLWSGKAPQAVSQDQYFLIVPADTYGKYFLAIQADWKKGKITWAAAVPGTKRAQAISTLSIEPGSIDALGGTRGPIKVPPGTEEGQWVIDRGFRNYEPWED